MITVKELRDALSMYPNDTEVVVDSCGYLVPDSLDDIFRYEGPAGERKPRLIVGDVYGD